MPWGRWYPCQGEIPCTVFQLGLRKEPRLRSVPNICSLKKKKINLTSVQACYYRQLTSRCNSNIITEFPVSFGSLLNGMTMIYQVAVYMMGWPHYINLGPTFLYIHYHYLFIIIGSLSFLFCYIFLLYDQQLYSIFLYSTLFGKQKYWRFSTFAERVLMIYTECAEVKVL